MNIQEATKKALESGKYITREGLAGEIGRIRIKPTDTPDCCIVLISDPRKIPSARVGKRWNPQAEDLMADNWIVVD